MTDMDHITVATEQEPPPPLVVMSLSVKITLNPKTGANEVTVLYVILTRYCVILTRHRVILTRYRVILTRYALLVTRNLVPLKKLVPETKYFRGRANILSRF